MANKRHKNGQWLLPSSDTTGNIESWDLVKVAVLMDLRDELQTANAKLEAIWHNANYTSYLLKEIRGLRRDVKKLKEAR